ncbi:MAG: ChuX/HutX family heme-like substrate-binding protein, partial [Pseudomonadota bacterium]
MKTEVAHRARSVDELKEAWRHFREENPKTRIRDAALALGVSEAELVATTCGESAIRLNADWGELLSAVHKLGRVMALTRNDHAVHEKHGVYNSVRIMGKMGLALDPEIDLRMFLWQWQHGFAVNEQVASGFRRSLQFFDVQGVAIHKIYLTEGSDEEAYNALVEQYGSVDQSHNLQVHVPPVRDIEQPDDDIDIEGFRAGWRELKDTHDFFDLVKDFGLTRTQALRLGGTEFARRTNPDLFADFMHSLVDQCLDIMVFVGNRGMIQIHSGPVCNLKRLGPWFNVLDPEFNLHLRDDAIDSAWVVRKPTVDGDVTSLELYDTNGEAIAYLFGARKPCVANKRGQGCV